MFGDSFFWHSLQIDHLLGAYGVLYDTRSKFYYALVYRVREARAGCHPVHELTYRRGVF